MQGREAGIIGGSWGQQPVEVRDQAPDRWLLLAVGEHLLLDVKCRYGGTHYPYLLQLTDEEVRAYAARGRLQLDFIADCLEEGVPILENSRSAYRGRDMSSSIHGDARAAVDRWRGVDRARRGRVEGAAAVRTADTRDLDGNPWHIAFLAWLLPGCAACLLLATPFLGAVSAAAIASTFGCAISARSPVSCEVMGLDLGERLYVYATPVLGSLMTPLAFLMAFHDLLAGWAVILLGLHLVRARR